MTVVSCNCPRAGLTEGAAIVHYEDCPLANPPAFADARGKAERDAARAAEDRTIGERMSEHEPDPIPNAGIPVWELVIRDMQERDRIGRERYGTPLQTFNGRRQLVDAYQESLDQTVYLRAEMAEEAERTALRLKADREGVSLDQMDRVAEALLNAEKGNRGGPWVQLERYQPGYVMELRIRALEALTGLARLDALALLQRLLPMAEPDVDSRP